MRRARGAVAVAGALCLLACSPPPTEVETTVGPSGSSTSGGTTATGSSSGSATAEGSTSSGGVGSGSASGTGLDAGSSGPLDSTGSGTTAALEGSGSSSSGTTGEVSAVGCADGFREALLDELAFPDVAACAGGFWVPGVGSPTPQCERQGGDDGPLPDGMGCSIEDLCAEGWHLCTSRQEVAAAGLAACEPEDWDGQFFATGQSGEGTNTCNDTGTNDVFGCGDVGYTSILNCAPLDRSTGNLCANLPGAWACNEDAYDEVAHLVKPGPGEGGALCCRDGV